MKKRTLAARLRIIAVACLVAVANSGCRGWDPFAFLDHCYLADRTNHHSCISCCPPGTHLKTER